MFVWINIVIKIIDLRLFFIMKPLGMIHNHILNDNNISAFVLIDELVKGGSNY